MMAGLTTKTIAELRDGFRAGEFSGREIANEYNAAVEAGRSLNAWTVETPELALAAADMADSARDSGNLKPLSGIPLFIASLERSGIPAFAGMAMTVPITQSPWALRRTHAARRARWRGWRRGSRRR